MVKGCDWLQDYLSNNPNLSDKDRLLCDGIEGSKSPSTASVPDISETATTPTLTQETAVDLVEKWLQEKHKVFAPPFDLQVLARYTTGRYFQKSQNTVDWLKSNNAYYQFESPLVEATGIFSVEGNQATVGVKVTESLSLYSQGQAKPSQNTTEYNFTLQLENGQWKIEDSQ